MMSIVGGKYTRDAKLRVLEHYFRNGGDVFGNKQATANKFNLDSKTVFRFLQVPELVALARRRACRHRNTTAAAARSKTSPVTAARGSPAARSLADVPLSDSEADSALLEQTAADNLSNVAKLIKVFDAATPELRDILLTECELVYECRVCRSLFRSVAQLLAHKRRFCRRRHQQLRQPFGAGPGQSLCLESAVEWQRQTAGVTERRALEAARNSLPRVLLEPVDGSRAAVYQTLSAADDDAGTPSMGQRAAELARVQARARDGATALLGTDGKLLPDGQRPLSPQTSTAAAPQPEPHRCPHCNTEFSTRKTLSQHVRSVHSSTRIYFPCPCCSGSFTSTFSLERHLQRVHKKKQDELERLKEKARAHSFQRSITPSGSAAEEDSAPTVASAVPQPALPPTATSAPDPSAVAKATNKMADSASVCLKCSSRFENAALLLSHHLSAHASSVAMATTGGIQVRRDYISSGASSRDQSPSGGSVTSRAVQSGDAGATHRPGRELVDAASGTASARFVCSSCGDSVIGQAQLLEHFVKIHRWSRKRAAAKLKRDKAKLQCDLNGDEEGCDGSDAGFTEATASGVVKRYVSRDLTSRTPPDAINDGVVFPAGTRESVPTTVCERRGRRKNLGTIIHYIRHSQQVSSQEVDTASSTAGDSQYSTVSPAILSPAQTSVGNSMFSSQPDSQETGDVLSSQTSDPWSSEPRSAPSQGSCPVGSSEGNAAQCPGDVATGPDQDDDLHSFVSPEVGEDVGSAWLRFLQPISDDVADIAVKSELLETEEVIDEEAMTLVRVNNVDVLGMDRTLDESLVADETRQTDPPSAEDPTRDVLDTAQSPDHVVDDVELVKSPSVSEFHVQQDVNENISKTTEQDVKTEGLAVPTVSLAKAASLRTYLRVQDASVISSGFYDSETAGCGPAGDMGGSLDEPGAVQRRVVDAGAGVVTNGRGNSLSPGRSESRCSSGGDTDRPKKRKRSSEESRIKDFSRYEFRMFQLADAALVNSGDAVETESNGPAVKASRRNSSGSSNKGRARDEEVPDDDSSQTGGGKRGRGGGSRGRGRPTVGSCSGRPRRGKDVSSLLNIDLPRPDSVVKRTSGVLKRSWSPGEDNPAE